MHRAVNQMLEVEPVFLVSRSVLSFIAVVKNSDDQYKIIWLCEILLSIKQPCSSVCPKKALEMLLTWSKKQHLKQKIEYFDLQQAWNFILFKFCEPDSQPAIKPFFTGLQIFHRYVQLCQIYESVNLLKICPLHHLAGAVDESLAD